MTGRLQATFASLLQALTRAAREVYGERLVSLAVFGSVGRGTPRFDSDVDLLVVVTGLPRGRMARVREFSAVEERLAPALKSAAAAGVRTVVNPVFKTPEEVEAGSLLFLDMVEDARLLYDRDGFLAGYLARLRKRLKELGAKRVRRGGAWYWLLKEDYRPGEVFEI
ncbi:MAG: nucleotidyltransferase domain-containing protein [Moorellales bacterium]